MTSVGPGGTCEWCGGPQWWTMAAGEMWVACQRDCQADQLEFWSPPTPDVKEGEEFDEQHWGTLNGEVGRQTPEGGDARTSAPRIHEPPVGWLSSLWEGGNDG